MDATSGTGAVIPHVDTAPYPLRPGNTIRPLVDGEPAFRRVCEAIEAARHSVWVTVTFMWPTFRMPDGRGTALDVLNRAAARGIDVRLIFWRPDEETASLRTNAFWGSAEHFTQLEAGHPTVRVRWDRAHPGYCQHQKCWLIDAGTETETAFLGGINLNPHAMVAPGHLGEGQIHDVYIELAGPAVLDIHHNFVQRWNGASERGLPDGAWGEGSDCDLPWPQYVPEDRGDVSVQIQRTIHRGRYPDGEDTPGGIAFESGAGERSIFDQYCAAINAARRSIYIENQHIAVAEIIDCLRHALERGVVIAAVVPSQRDPSGDLAALGSFRNFTLAGLAGQRSDGTRSPVWIHSKLMIVDGNWGTVGSCNLHRYSLFGNGELNAAFWDRKTALTLLRELLQEHLDTDITGMDDLAAIQQFGTIARKNRACRDDGQATWRGLAFSLLPSGGSADVGAS